jgi:hypothetical protein
MAQRGVRYKSDAQTQKLNYIGATKKGTTF